MRVRFGRFFSIRLSLRFRLIFIGCPRASNSASLRAPLLLLLSLLRRSFSPQRLPLNAHGGRDLNGSIFSLAWFGFPLLFAPALSSGLFVVFFAPSFGRSVSSCFSVRWVFFFSFFLSFLLVFSVLSSYLHTMSLLSIFPIVSSASSVGFCGSRSVVPPSAVFSSVAWSLSPLASLSVGCAGGSDALVRSWFPSASVFSVSSFGSGRGAFARRSSAFVSALAVSPAPLLVGFPAVACPPALLPSRFSFVCFRGLGSGSWASLALASGLGVSCLVWLPAGVSAPLSWGFQSFGGGWWFLPARSGSLF